MPLDDWDFEDWNYDRDGDPWEYVEHVYLEIGENGDVEVSAEIDGEIYEFGAFSGSEAQDEIWDELYWWCVENDVEIDKEVDY